MSVRVDKVENGVSSRLGEWIRPAGWRRWGQRPARQDVAVRDAAKLLNEYGKDAYWLACLCERRSQGARGEHWHAVTKEIERRTGRRSPATPGKTTGSLRAALDQIYVPPHADLRTLDPYHAGAPDDRYEQHSHPHGRDRRASQIAAKEFDRHQEHDVRVASAARVAHDRADNSDRSAAIRLHDEEMDDKAPRKDRRRGVVALALIGFAMVGAAGAYAYRTYHVAPPSTQSSAAPSQAGQAQAAVQGYVVQVSARRSETDARASFRSLQSKFPRQLGGRTAIVQRADLGVKGIYYRALVGPFASAGAADQFCSSLKAAGGQCVIQRN
jgi:cell division septation protein DedD